MFKLFETVLVPGVSKTFDAHTHFITFIRLDTLCTLLKCFTSALIKSKDEGFCVRLYASPLTGVTQGQVISLNNYIKPINVGIV